MTNGKTFLEKKPLPPPQKLPEQGQFAAVRTDDGSIYYDPQTSGGRTHLDLIRDLGIPPERVVGGGWLIEGVYEETERSDAARIGEQARARLRAQHARAVRQAFAASEGNYGGIPMKLQDDDVRRIAISLNAARHHLREQNVDPSILSDLAIAENLLRQATREKAPCRDEIRVFLDCVEREGYQPAT
jgi:hypothetical protein